MKNNIINLKSRISISNQNKCSKNSLDNLQGTVEEVNNAKIPW